MTNHQTIAITSTGLAELAHSEYQVFESLETFSEELRFLKNDRRINK